MHKLFLSIISDHFINFELLLCRRVFVIKVYVPKAVDGRVPEAPISFTSENITQLVFNINCYQLKGCYNY